MDFRIIKDMNLSVCSRRRVEEYKAVGLTTDDVDHALVIGVASKSG